MNENAWKQIYGLKLPAHGLYFTSDSLENAIRSYVPWDNVQAVVAFGSCTRPPTGYLGMFKKKPNDLDLCVFVKDKEVKFNKKRTIVFQREKQFSYSVDWVTDHDTQHFLHLMSTTEEEWMAALQTKHDMAQTILNGVIIYSDGTLSLSIKSRYKVSSMVHNNDKYVINVSTELIKPELPIDIDIEEDLFKPQKEEYYGPSYSLGE